MNPLYQRLLAKIKLGKNRCWIWTGGKSKAGYGMIYIDRTMKYVHRLSYEIFNETLIGNNDIHHKCENKLCINPVHLTILSHNEHSTLVKNPKANQTHCKYGHEFTKENTGIIKRANGKLNRYCKTCNNVSLEMKKALWQE